MGMIVTTITMNGILGFPISVRDIRKQATAITTQIFKDPFQVGSMPSFRSTYHLNFMSTPPDNQNPPAEIPLEAFETICSDIVCDVILRKSIIKVT